MSEPPAVQPFLIADAGVWTEVRDGNAAALALMDRHYSRSRYRDGRRHDRFVGPGERLVLLTADVRALCVWRKFISKDAQEGINCAAFRNEGASLSSDLLRVAMARAWVRWPGARLYTYVNPRKVRSTNPGCCSKKAGWKRCGITKTRKLLVFECLPTTAEENRHKTAGL